MCVRVGDFLFVNTLQPETIIISFICRGLVDRKTICDRCASINFCFLALCSHVSKDFDYSGSADVENKLFSEKQVIWKKRVETLKYITEQRNWVISDDRQKLFTEIFFDPTE